MGTISLSFAVALISMGLAITCSFAMASLVFWQAPAHRVNLLIGSYLLTSGIVLLLNFFIRLGYLLPDFSYVREIVYLQLYLLPSLSYLLFIGIIFYTDFWSGKTRRWIVSLSTGFLLVFFLINAISPSLLLTNYDTLTYLSGAELDLQVTPLLLTLQVVALIWGVAGLFMAWRADTHRYLFGALFLIFAVGFLDTIPFLRNWNLNSLIGLTGRILLTFAILDDNLFNPLKTLNTKLVQSQQSLRQAYDEVEILVEQRTHELEEALGREKDLSKQLETALQKEEELNQLRSHIIETVSHEFRTPLTVIQTAVDLIHRYKERLSEQKIDKQFERVRNQIFYLTDLLRDTIFISHVRDNALTPNWQCISLKQVHHQITDLVTEEEVLAPLVSIHLNVLDESEEITTDTELIRRILLNLLINAFKYGDSKPITLKIYDDGPNWYLSVADQGIGILEGEIDKLFDLFYRGSNVETRRGLGLGLNIAKEIVTALHGHISIKSEGVNQGSCFTIRFNKHPIKQPKALAHPQDSKTLSNPVENLESQR